jgi:hypothetical protein
MAAMIGDDVNDAESESAEVKNQQLQNALTLYNRSSELLSSVQSALVLSKANERNQTPADVPTPPQSQTISRQQPPTPQDVFTDDRDDTAKTMTCVQFLSLLLITLQKQQEVFLMLLPAIVQAQAQRGQPLQSMRIERPARVLISNGGKGKYKSRKMRKMRKMRKISRNRRRSNRKSARSTRKKQKYVKKYSMYKRY